MCLDSVLGMVLGTVGGGVGKGDVRRCKKNGLLTREQMSSNRLKALLGQVEHCLGIPQIKVWR